LTVPFLQVLLTYTLILSTKCSEFDLSKLADKLNSMVAGRLLGAAASVTTEFTCTDLTGAAAAGAPPSPARSRMRMLLLSASSDQGRRKLLLGAKASSMAMKAAAMFESSSPSGGGVLSPFAALAMADSIVRDLRTDAARAVSDFAREEGVPMEETVEVRCQAAIV
jgi:hypothetical protein